MSDPAPLDCTVISDGRRGIENQALGIAESLSRLCPTQIRTITIKHNAIFRALPPRLQFRLRRNPSSYGLPTNTSTSVPHLYIGCGRQAIAPLLALKSSLQDRAFCVYIQAPRIDIKHFDLVIAPRHDGIDGDNVVNMIGSPHRLTPELLEFQKRAFAASLKAFPAPRAVVLMGGKSKNHKITKPIHEAHKKTIKGLLDNGFSVLMTTSRRTPKWVTDYYKLLNLGYERLWVWDNMGDNPYFAFLSAADIIFVTEDSTNMLTEASATKVPVMRLPMHGSSPKFDLLYQQLIATGRARLFKGEPNSIPDMIRGQYPPMEETARVVRILKHRYDEFCRK